MQSELISPQNLEAEQALLGAAMMDEGVAYEIGTVLLPSDFYSMVHDVIFKIIIELLHVGVRPDKIAVAGALRSAGELERIGGVSYLSLLMDTVQTVSSARYYAEIVREKSMLRSLSSAGKRIEQLGYEGEDDASEAIRQANNLLGFVVDRGMSQRELTPAQAMKNYDAATERSMGLAYKTPWPHLDKMTGGFTPDELVVFASDSGFGKSMLLNMLAAFQAEKYGSVAFFATEMGAIKTIARFIALYSGVSARKQRQGMTKHEQKLVKSARARLSDLPLLLFDDTMRSDEIVAHCRRLHHADNLQGIFIDTLGAVSDLQGIKAPKDSKYNHSRHELQTSVVWRLKTLAKELQLPVYVAHHLSRGERKSGRPNKNILRDGGGLEHTATTIIFPHREISDMTDDRTGETKKVQQHMLIVDKARDGDEGILPMEFYGAKALWLEEGQDRPWFDPEPEEMGLLDTTLAY